MAQRMRASSLSLKLNVIVEDNSNSSPDQSLTHESSAYALQSDQPITSHAVTIRNADQSGTADPQFLHGEQWPSMDMIHGVSHSGDQSSPNDIAPEWASSERSLERREVHPKTVRRTGNNWRAVTAAQLSMVMDYWNPDRDGLPFVSEPASTVNDSLTSPDSCRTVTTLNHAIFHREILDEHNARVQTVAHLEELDDNDTGVEIVAILEGYRQTGWAEEMIQAFPKECWLFWATYDIESSGCVHDFTECTKDTAVGFHIQI